jgi:hypothetical protein
MNSEWTTVPSKGAYIPPYMRNKMAANTSSSDKKVDGLKTTAADFPSLLKSATPKTQTAFAPSAISYKQKVHDLIANEQLSEIERTRELEASQALEGFVSLSLKITPEWRNKCYQNYVKACEVENHLMMYGENMYTPHPSSNSPLDYEIIDASSVDNLSDDE